MTRENQETSIGARKNGRHISAIGHQRRLGGSQMFEYHQQLAELNREFPGERRKPFDQRNPDYNRRRAEINHQLDSLKPYQSSLRCYIRSLVG